MKGTRKPQKPKTARKAEAPAGGKRVTLPRALSKLGFCSRTQAEALVDSLAYAFQNGASPNGSGADGG